MCTTLIAKRIPTSSIGSIHEVEDPQLFKRLLTPVSLLRPEGNGRPQQLSTEMLFGGIGSRKYLFRDKPIRDPTQVRFLAFSDIWGLQ